MRYVKNAITTLSRKSLAGFVFMPDCEIKLLRPARPRRIRQESMQRRNRAEHFIADKLEIRGDARPILGCAQLLDSSPNHFLRRFARIQNPYAQDNRGRYAERDS